MKSLFNWNKVLFVSALFVAFCLISCNNVEVKTEAISNEGEKKSDTVLASNDEQASRTCACDVMMYLNDPDTSGTNVRDKVNGNIIRKLHYDKECLCLTVKIKSADDQWLELEEGGWVFGPLFAIGSRNYAQNEKVYLNESPSDESATVAEYQTEQEFKVLSCNGSWLYVEGKDKKRGWLNKEMQCPSAVTTCP